MSTIVDKEPSSLKGSQSERPNVKQTARRRFARWKIPATVAASSLFALLIVEVIVRLAGLDMPRVWEPDPILGWHHIPGARRHFTEEGNGLIEINSLGHRDRPRFVAKPEGTVRIMALGDSMTEADQVNLDETFCYIVEERLKGDQPVEVLNFGVNGYSPLQELLVLKQDGQRYRPDVVMVCLFLDNDVSGCHPSLSTVADQSPFARLNGDKLVIDYSRAEQSSRDYHRQPIHLVRKNSATYRWLRTMDQRRAGAAVGMGIPKRYQLYAEPCPPAWEEAWSVLERVLLELASETDRIGAKLVILSLPCAQIVDPQSWENIQQQFPAMKSQTWDLERPERRLREFAALHDLVLFQPLQEFRAAAKKERLFFGNVGHMNARGHQLAAELIAAFIQQQGLLPSAKERIATKHGGSSSSPEQ